MPTCTNTCSRFKCCWLCSLALIIPVAVIKRSSNCLVFFTHSGLLIRKSLWDRKNVIVPLFRKKKSTCCSINTAIREDGASCRGEQGQRLVYFVLLKWTDLFLFFFLFFFPLLHNLLARMHMLERVTEAEAGRQDDFQCFLVGHWGMDKYSTCNNKWKRQRLSELLSSPLLSVWMSRSGGSDVQSLQRHGYFLCLGNNCQFTM